LTFDGSLFRGLVVARPLIGEFQAKIDSERKLREIRAALEKKMSNVKM